MRTITADARRETRGNHFRELITLLATAYLRLRAARAGSGSV